MKLKCILSCVPTLLAGAIGVVHAQSGQTLVIQSTTSTRNSGLYDHLLPQFTRDTGIKAFVVAVGTGQAIENARNCDGDVLLVHDTKSEQEFVKAGYGNKRWDVMYNDFVLLGPKSDPAAAKGQSIAEALENLAASQSLFISRGDNSGTHKAELRLWQLARRDPKPASGDWYLEVGAGMGAALNIAAEKNAYVLSDRATYTAFANKQNLAVLVEGGAELFNQYGVIALNPDHCPARNHQAAAQFVNWIVGEKGQSAIADYQRDGQQLFFPGKIKE